MSEESTALAHSQSLLTHQTEEAQKKIRNYGTITPSSSTQEDSQSTNGDNNNDNNIVSDQSTNSSGSITPEHMKSTLSFIQKFGFGLGHVYNDLCAGVWFSYTLLFMQSALLISAPEAGALVMLGQVSDAISTPIVGLLVDRYGTKRKWHIFGTGLVFSTFPLIFSLCPWCRTAPFWWQPLYFSLFIIMFQFAWAVVQITHLAMIPEMSRTNKDRADLTATRYSASVCSNVIVYIVTWAVLQGRDKMNNNIGPTDAYRFRDISLIITLVGISMSVLFQFSLSLSGYEQRRLLSLANTQQQIPRSTLSQKHCDNVETGSNNSIDRGEPSTSTQIESADTEKLIQNHEKNTTDIHKVQSQSKPFKNFLKLPILYQNTFLYVFSRLFMTTSLVYMPLWLDERSWKPNSSDLPSGAPNAGSGEANVEHIATIPLVSFLASFIASMILKHVNRFCGHQVFYFIGSVISIGGCLWIALATPAEASTLQLFGIAILFGAGSSITMISSLCITADMIGRHTYQGGFIYSAVTFADKLITGIVVVVIETLKCKSRTECPEYYRNVLAYACGVAATLGILTLSTLRCTRRNSNNRRHSS